LRKPFNYGEPPKHGVLHDSPPSTTIEGPHSLLIFSRVRPHWHTHPHPFFSPNARAGAGAVEPEPVSEQSCSRHRRGEDSRPLPPLFLTPLLLLPLLLRPLAHAARRVVDDLEREKGETLGRWLMSRDRPR